MQWILCDENPNEVNRGQEIIPSRTKRMYLYGFLQQQIPINAKNGPNIHLARRIVYVCP